MSVANATEASSTACLSVDRATAAWAARNRRRAFALTTPFSAPISARTYPDGPASRTTWEAPTARSAHPAMAAVRIGVNVSRPNMVVSRALRRLSGDELFLWPPILP